MNTYISETIRARETKFDDNISVLQPNNFMHFLIDKEI